MSLVSNLILPPSVFNQRTAPEWFTKALKDIDWRLMVYFNHMRGRWIIDRCTKGVTAENLGAGLPHEHDNGCPRTNVLVVRGPDNSYHPLGQDVIDWFKANDVGNRYDKAEDLVCDLTAKDDANKEKMRLERKDNTRHHTLDHKRQLLQIKHIIDQHDLEPNEGPNGRFANGGMTGVQMLKKYGKRKLSK